MPLKRTMKEVEVLEEGTYRVQLMDLKETTLENPQFGNGDVIRFVMETTEVVDSEGNRVELDGIANDKLTPLSKLTQWLTAFGVTADPGAEIDMEEAVGREAMAVVIHVPGKDGTGAFPRVDKIVPLPKTGRSAPSQRPTNGINDSDPDFDAFWKSVKAVGFEPKDVMPYLDGDLNNIKKKTQAQLDKILEEMGI